MYNDKIDLSKVVEDADTRLCKQKWEEVVSFVCRLKEELNSVIAERHDTQAMLDRLIKREGRIRNRLDKIAAGDWNAVQAKTKPERGIADV